MPPCSPRCAASTPSPFSVKTTRARSCAKGGDYAVSELPEAATLAEWGGHAVVVPYVAGRSTTRLIEVARAG